MRGFTNIFRVESTPVNIEILEGFKAGSDVTVEKLVSIGAVRKKNARVKILGNGELTKKLNVIVHGFSKHAKQKIEDAGGTATVIGAVEASESTDAESAK